jgi:tRNA nucleotidyltransferase/poly(A) polymerase
VGREVDLHPCDADFATNGAKLRVSAGVRALSWITGQKLDAAVYPIKYAYCETAVCRYFKSTGYSNSIETAIRRPKGFTFAEIKPSFTAFSKLEKSGT